MTERWYWRARLVQGGPFIPIMTWRGAPVVDGETLDRHPRWQALVRNETTARAIMFGDEMPLDVDDSRPDQPNRSLSLRNLERIDEAEWRYLVEHAAWSTQYAPHLPDAAPRTKISKKGPSVW